MRGKWKARVRASQKLTVQIGQALSHVKQRAEGQARKQGGPLPPGRGEGGGGGRCYVLEDLSGNPSDSICQAEGTGG